MKPSRSLRNAVSVKNQGTQYRNAGELPEQLQKFAKFSQVAYEPQDEFLGYKLDKELSDKQFSVYNKGKKTIFAVKGSSELVNDFLINDMQIMRGDDKHLQYHQGKSRLGEVRLKYGDNQIRITGHSLGGAAALVAIPGSWVHRVLRGL